MRGFYIEAVRYQPRFLCGLILYVSKENNMEESILKLSVSDNFLVRDGAWLKGVVTCCRNKTTKERWYATEFYTKAGTVYKPFFSVSELVKYIRRISA